MAHDDFKKEFVYKTTLRDVYGMTDRMIDELGEPDKRVKNPHYRSGPLSKLYSIERVEEWCDAHREELDRAHQARAKRQESVKKANETKYNAIIEWAKTVEITLDPPASYEAAWDAVTEHYAFRAWDNDRYRDDAVTYGGVLAYMRHELTNYDHLLRQISGKVGTHEAYAIIRERVDDLVGHCLQELQSDHLREANVF